MLYLYNNNNLKNHLIKNMLKYYYINNNIINKTNQDYKTRLELYKRYDIRDFIIDYDYKNIELIFILAIYPRNENYKNILDEIYKYTNNIIIIYSINPEYDIEMKYITNLSKTKNIYMIEVENIGYDFYKYYVGIIYCLQNIKFDRIILINDSFQFTRSINDFISYIKLSHNKFNLIGLNNSYEIKIHIQSFILSFDKEICKEFIQYYKKYNNKNHKLQDIIDVFEIGFSNYIINNNKYKIDTFYYITTNKNPYLEPEYSNLIKLFNYPIKKTKLK